MDERKKLVLPAQDVLFNAEVLALCTPSPMLHTYKGLFNVWTACWGAWAST